MISPTMFRDAIRDLSLRKKLAILASFGVILPLLVLTSMQYRSLSDLQSKTKGALKDNLRQGVTMVEHQMKRRLEDVASQTLIPLDNIHFLSPGVAQELEKYFTDVKRLHPEIEEIFAFAAGKDTNRSAYVYSDKFVNIAQPDFTPLQSDILSLFDKAWISQSFLGGNRKVLFIHPSCLPCPPGLRQGAYLFYPLKNLVRGEPTSFAGVFLNESFVRDDLIANSIDATINRYHTNNAASSDLAFTISDENSRVLYANASAQTRYFLETNLDRPFSSWKTRIGLKNTDLDALARNSFLHSVGATLIVLVVLICGIALILRATDREARLAQAKSNFVSNVSHELKTPLSLISLFSEILELGRVNSEEKKAEYYRIIHHESQRLNKMIDNILDFSKIEAGRKTYEFAESDLAEVIEEVLSNYRYQIINAGFVIQTNIQPNLPSVFIDRDAMGQAISNLLDNAIKYASEVKQIMITAETHGNNLAIEIADHGIGIPRTEHAKIFEKFYRVGNGLVHDVKGSGLGLSLVKHIIAVHQGTISVESEVDKGSRFRVLLPLNTQASGMQQVKSKEQNEVGQSPDH